MYYWVSCAIKRFFRDAFSQPRSQGSLLPALRSSVGRVGENPGNEVGIFVVDTHLPRFEALAYDLPHFDALTHVLILVSAAFIFRSGLLRSDILRKGFIF